MVIVYNKGNKKGTTLGNEDPHTSLSWLLHIHHLWERKTAKHKKDAEKKIHYYIDVTYETKYITFRTQERKTRNAVILWIFYNKNFLMRKEFINGKLESINICVLFLNDNMNPISTFVWSFTKNLACIQITTTCKCMQ